MPQKLPKVKKIPKDMVDFSRAFLKYNNDQKDKGMMLKYQSALKVHAKALIPLLLATQEKWNEVFDKF